MERDREIEVVHKMIKLYCIKKHKNKTKLCDECQKLYEYACHRRTVCPYGDNKPFCSNCKTHCYIPKMREKIREVMRFSGPRMIIYNPKVAISHLRESLKEKRKSKKEEKRKIKEKGNS